MTGITDSLTISMITTSAGNFFAVFAPYIELLVGVLLAFLVISYLVSLFKRKPAEEDINNNV